VASQTLDGKRFDDVQEYAATNCDAETIWADLLV
jgi:hypothetical protein